MNTLNFGLEMKTLDDAGVVEGLASTYGNTDRVGDVVQAGAFTKTLRESGGRLPLLWQHKQDHPIGDARIIDMPGRGLFLRGQLDLDVEDGRRAHSALKRGYVRGLSIGYDVVRSTMRNGVRQLLELKLWEVSVVTIPANAEAVITGVKDTDAGALAFVTDMNARLQQLADEVSTRVLMRQIRNFASSRARQGE
jgi:uncharacterized protein